MSASATRGILGPPLALSGMGRLGCCSDLARRRPITSGRQVVTAFEFSIESLNNWACRLRSSPDCRRVGTGSVNGITIETTIYAHFAK